jgi:hypothetical protein
MKAKLTIFICLFLCTFCIICKGKVPFKDNGKIYKTKNEANIYNQADYMSDVIIRVPADKKVKVIDKTNDIYWFVTYKNHQGYIKRKSLSEGSIDGISVDEMIKRANEGEDMFISSSPSNLSSTDNSPSNTYNTNAPVDYAKSWYKSGSMLWVGLGLLIGVIVLFLLKSK